MSNELKVKDNYKSEDCQEIEEMQKQILLLGLSPILAGMVEIYVETDINPLFSVMQIRFQEKLSTWKEKMEPFQLKTSKLLNRFPNFRCYC